MQNKFAVYVANALAISLLLVGNLVLVNLISRQVPLRVDLTERNAYTVSEVTQERLGKVKDELVVRYYVSRETLPKTREFRILEREVLDRLESYRKGAGAGRIRIEVEDPLDGEDRIEAETREEWAARRILPVQLDLRVDEGKTREFEFYSSLKMIYRGREEVINQISDPRDLEYEFVVSLNRLLDTALPKVGVAFVVSDQESEWKKTIEEKVFRLLGERAAIRKVELEKGPADLQDLDVLYALVKDEVTETQLYELDQFVMHGGRLVLCTDIFSLGRQFGGGGMRGMMPRWEIFDTGLSDFAEHLGVRLKKELVFDIGGDARKFPTTIPRGPYLYSAYVYLSFEIKAKRDSFNPAFPVTRGVDGLLFQFPHAIEPVPGKEGIEYEYLVRSSEKSWEEDVAGKPFLSYEEITEDFLVDEAAESRVRRWHREEEARTRHPGPFRSTMGGVLRGKFRSYFADRKTPDGVASANYDLEEEEVRQETGGRSTILSSPETRVVLLGDTDWMEKITDSTANRDFLVQLTNWLVQDERYAELIGKASPAPPLFDEADPAAREAFEKAKPWYLLLMTALSPLLVLAFGIAKIVLRYQEKVVQASESSKSMPMPVQLVETGAGDRKEGVR